MYILSIVKAIEKMSVNDIKDFIFESCYESIRFFKENSYYSMKRLKKKRKSFIAACKQINRKKMCSL